MPRFYLLLSLDWFHDVSLRFIKTVNLILFI